MDAASAHLARLGAISRPSGSVAAAEARQYCADVLRGLGFTVRERPFEFSKFPGAWATPLAGSLVPPFATGIAYVHSAPRWFAIGLVAALACAGALFAYVGRAGVLDLGVMRRSGVNLEAVRGDAEPNVWLVAHVDSKWQPVSMMLRVAGVVLSFGGLVVLAVLSFLRDGRPSIAMLIVLAITCAGAVPLMLSYVGNRNHGTLDNASGVAAVLEAAEILAPNLHVGVLITDAEELGLAGARAWARERKTAVVLSEARDRSLPKAVTPQVSTATPGIALNCDSLDDDGSLTVMRSSPSPTAVLTAMSNAARTASEPLRVIRLIPGILTDHVALADAGWATVTLSRGTIRTLQRIHTSRDTLATMRGTGIAGAARVLAQTATELC